MRRPTLILAAAAMTGLALAGCSSTTSTTSTSTAPSVAVPSVTPTIDPSALASEAGGGYSDAIETGFMSTCPSSAQQANSSLSEADATAYCGCVYRAFEAKLPFDQFIALNSGSTSEAAKSLVQECVNDPKAY